MDIFLIIIIVVFLLIFLLGWFLISYFSSKLLKTSIKQKQNIINTKPKRIVEYLDAFFYNNTSNNDTGDWFQVCYIVRDINTKEIFAIDEVNSKGIRLELMHDIVKIYKGDISKREVIKFGDRGSLWIDENVKSNSNLKTKYKYGGCITDSSFKGVNKRHIIYNTNNKYDLSLFENAKGAFGILSFEE